MNKIKKSASSIIEECKTPKSTTEQGFLANSTNIEISSIINNSYKFSNYFYQLGIDSIHITSEVHPFDLREEFNLHINEKDKDYIRNFYIYLSNDYRIKCRYHKRWRTFTYEFGGLFQLKDIDSKIVKILKYVYGIDSKIKEIHFALDVKASYKDFKIKATNYDKKSKESGVYYNSDYSNRTKKVTLSKYNKNQINNSKYGGIAYEDITRLELRFHRQYLSNGNIENSFYNPESLQKLSSKVIKEFNDLQIVYQGKLLTFNDLKVEDILYNFIEFLQSSKNQPEPVYKKFIGEIKKQSEILKKLKTYFCAKNMCDVVYKYNKRKISISNINRDTGISRDILRKVINYYSIL